MTTDKDRLQRQLNPLPCDKWLIRHKKSKSNIRHHGEFANFSDGTSRVTEQRVDGKKRWGRSQGGAPAVTHRGDPQTCRPQGRSDPTLKKMAVGEGRELCSVISKDFQL